MEGKSVGIHLEPGPDGGLVMLDDTTVLDRALKILDELCPPKKFRTVSTCKPSSSAILCMLPLGNESLILRSSLNVIVLMSHKFNG